MDSEDKNLPLTFEDKCGFYVEGVLCAFAVIQWIVEAGAVPQMFVTIPATPEMRSLSRRARVHFLVEEPAPPHDIVCIFEGEVSGRDFKKSADGRGLSFPVHHVVWHLDQYEMEALDNLVYIRALLNGTASTENVVATVTGSLLELFTPDNLVAILNDPAYVDKTTIAPGVKTAKVSADKLTVGDFVRGAFLLYRHVFNNSRIAATYTNDAMTFHQLGARFQLPDPAVVDWTDLYKRLMFALLTRGVNAAGGKQTFLDLVRTVCAQFLHQVVVQPHAESVTKQVQIKPQTFFNAIPNCNVVFPSMTGEVDFQESFTNKPTRMRTMFMPFGLSPDQDVSVLNRYFTVYAPVELQWRWEGISQVAAQSKPTAPQRAVDAKTKAPIIKKPVDGIPFVTQEEDARGIVSVDYPMPPMLNYAIMSEVSTYTRDAIDANLSPVDGTSDPAEVYKRLQSGTETDRLTKYRAFLSLALGHANGIDPQRFKSAPYLREFVNLDKLGGVVLPDTPTMVPTRIALMPLPIKVNLKSHTPTRQALVNTGVNYLVTRDGVVVEILRRDHQLFPEPLALPLGLKLAGVGNPGDYAALNKLVPPFGVARSEARGMIDFQAKNLVVPPVVYPEAAAVATNASYGDYVLLRPAVASNQPINFQTVRSSTMDEAMFARIRAGETSVHLEGGGLSVSGVVQGKTHYVKTNGNASQNDNCFVLKLPESIKIPFGVPLTLTINTKTSFVAGKPWLFCNHTKQATSASTLSHWANLGANQGIDAAVADNQVVGGNVGTVVIGFETLNGTLTGQQATMGAFLCAAIRQMGVKSVGETKAPKLGPATILMENVVEASSLYGPGARLDTSVGPLDVNGIKAQVSFFEQQLFKDFNTWDKDLTAGNTSSIGAPAVDVSAADRPTALPVDPATHSVFADNADLPTTPGMTPVSDADAKKLNAIGFNGATLQNFVHNYVSGYLNHQFYNARLGPQSYTGRVEWNPYMMVDYPALIVDNEHTSFDLVGHVHAIAMTFTPTSVEQQVTYTHLRPAIGAVDVVQTDEGKATPVGQREAMIPFKTARKQELIYVMPPDRKIARDPVAYQQYLKAQGLFIPETFLPIQLHDLGAHKPPPFLYMGGFGLGKQFLSFDKTGVPNSFRDFSGYAIYLGYVTEANNQKALPTHENNLVFADTLGTLDRAKDVQTAYQFTRRPIQKVGQNDLTKRQACLVAWADEAEELNGDVATGSENFGLSLLNQVLAPLGKKPTPAAKQKAQVGFGEAIVVYTVPPTYDAKGNITAKGTTLEFDEQVRALVRAHTFRVRRKEAIWDGR